MLSILTSLLSLTPRAAFQQSACCGDDEIARNCIVSFNGSNYDRQHFHDQSCCGAPECTFTPVPFFAQGALCQNYTYVIVNNKFYDAAGRLRMELDNYANATHFDTRNVRVYTLDNVTIPLGSLGVIDVTATSDDTVEVLNPDATRRTSMGPVKNALFPSAIREINVYRSLAPIRTCEDFLLPERNLTIYFEFPSEAERDRDVETVELALGAGSQTKIGDRYVKAFSRLSVTLV